MPARFERLQQFDETVRRGDVDAGDGLGRDDQPRTGSAMLSTASSTRSLEQLGVCEKQRGIPAEEDEARESGALSDSA